jgi:hypothetical protein
MKIRKYWLATTAVAMLLSVNAASMAEAGVLKIQPNFQRDPLTVSGTSGGPRSSDCGNIAATPNYTLQVTESLPYVRVSVQGGEQPTLLMDGPTGHFCVLAEPNSRDNAEISGYLQPGTYSLYVGDRGQGRPYTLSISQKKR